MDHLEHLIEKEHVTYQQLESMYNQCKASLDEFNAIFHHKKELVNSKDMETFLNLKHLQNISKDIQSLSNRVIQLEKKIECFSKTVLKGGNQNNNNSSPAPNDRKKLPGQSHSQGGDERPRAREKSSSMSTGTPLIIPETIDRELTLRGGSETPPPQPLPRRGAVSGYSRRKEKGVTWSSDKRNGGKSQTTPAIECDSYDKVSKLIPELLDKFEEFHRCFSRALKSEQTIDLSTAANILKVMDGQRKLLEKLEVRLRQTMMTGSKEAEE